MVLIGSIFADLIAGNIVDKILIIMDVKKTKNISLKLISAGNEDK
tara:strand:+ start:649 stop:783 length:135 start_codon:yes stop_codon:yes gene_type:complete